MTAITAQAPAGRTKELAALAAWAAAASAGHPQAAVVHGSAGLGKSHLVDCFLQGRDAAGILRASGSSWETGMAGGVLSQLLPGAVPEDPALAGALLLDRLRALAEDAPLGVLWIDDLQWADELSLRALVYALRRLRSERLLVLMAVRDEQWQLLPAGFREAAGSAVVHLLGLQPLAPRDVSALAWQVRSAELSAPMALRLCLHTEGNPAYVLELLDQQPDGFWADWHEHLPVPRRLDTAARAALAEAGAGTRALVESASVLVQGCRLVEAVELAEKATSLRIADPLESLDEAGRLELLQLSPDLSLPAFRHPLVRAAVYASLSASRRAELHRLAAAMADDEGQRLFHLARATPLPDPELAGQLEAYARRQSERGAWLSAAPALLRSAYLWPDAAGRQERLLLALDALVGAGDLPQAGPYARQAEDFAPGPLREAVLGYLSIQRGREPLADRHLDNAWGQSDPRSDPHTAAMICQRRVLHSLAAQNGDELIRWARRAMELAPEDSPEFVESRSIMGLGLASTGRADEAAELYAKLPSMESLGAQRQRVQLGRGWLYLAQDQHYRARDQLVAAVPTEYHLGSGRISQWAHGWLSRAEFELGHWDEALRTVERGLVQQERLQIQLARPLLHLTAAQIHALRGDRDRSAYHQDAARVPADSYAIMRLPAALALAAGAEAAADYESVLRALEPVVHMDRSHGIDEPGFWPWHDVYANALVMADRADQASDFLAPHEELAARRRHRTTMARLASVRGRILGAEGRLDEAKKAFAAGLAGVEALPTPIIKARIRFAYGQTLRRGGRRREAAAVLAEARDIFLSLGAAVYVQRCEREIQASGLATGVRRGELDFSVLTAQELAVARLVAQGRTNKETGLELFIAAKTVQYHLTRIYAKLGISSRSELAARYRADEAG
jgi:DNA-binding CsgD family transcriptional regulator